MGFFSRRNKVIDLTEKYKKDQEKLSNIRSEMNEENTIEAPSQEQPAQPSGLGGFFSAISNTANQISNNSTETESSNELDEKKRRLIKRLTEMTEKIENISNQIYHLEQRIEVLERKNNVNGY